MTNIIPQCLLMLVFAISTLGHAQTEDRNLDQQLAIQGYDPVAYFTNNRAVEGSKDLTIEHEGAIYQFSSEKNQNLLVSN